jgi:phosphoribosylformimino-5-aminoimidazole carboxamide ribotide isomerase
LLQGRAEAETVFSNDPVAMAERWEAEGAPRLHVVDLDGAFGGGPVQTAVIRTIARAVSIPLEVGGGLRQSSTSGPCSRPARWAIVGTRAALDPAFSEAAARFEIGSSSS